MLQNDGATKSEKVLKLGIKREKDFLYYLDGDTQVCRVKLASDGREPSAKSETVVKITLRRDPDHIYFVDSDGDISRSKV